MLSSSFFASAFLTGLLTALASSPFGTAAADWLAPLSDVAPGSLDASVAGAFVAGAVPGSVVEVAFVVSVASVLSGVSAVSVASAAS